jgi:CRISPR-associated protein Csm1
MPVQVFLQGKLLGTNEFLFAPAQMDHDSVFAGRSHWISLLSEVLPRALLAELGLSRILLGSSGGGQFLLVLPEEVREAAAGFLRGASDEITLLSGGMLKLIWAMTENLGDWSDVRKRLNDEIELRRGTPAAGGFSSTEISASPDAESYFAQLGRKVRTAEFAGWSPESPGRVLAIDGKHRWPLGTASLSSPQDALPFARHAAPDERTGEPATTADLAARSSGLATWGVLRGDIDNFGIRIRRAQNIEEHVQLSVMYKQFFAGELEVLCSTPEYWQKVTVIYSGGDDFAVYGAWDALIGLAREMERLVHRFVEANLKDFPGAEGKTITMALALAPSLDASLGAVFEEAGHRLETAKSADKDCIWVLGRILEWKQFAEASELKDLLMRMVSDFGCSPQYLRDLCGIYRETQSKLSKRQTRRRGGERPWRYHRRIRGIMAAARPFSGPARGEYQKARNQLIAELIGRSAGTVKLRPAGRVALEWARLSAETSRT